jgi:type I site-specific restriction endonuclease
MSNILNWYFKNKRKNSVHFLDTVTVYETYSCEEYDRTNTVYETYSGETYSGETYSGEEYDKTNTDMQSLEIQTNTTLLGYLWTRILNIV